MSKRLDMIVTAVLCLVLFGTAMATAPKQAEARDDTRAAKAPRLTQKTARKRTAAEMYKWGKSRSNSCRSRGLCDFEAWGVTRNNNGDFNCWPDLTVAHGMYGYVCEGFTLTYYEDWVDANGKHIRHQDEWCERHVYVVLAPDPSSPTGWTLYTRRDDKFTCRYTGIA